MADTAYLLNAEDLLDPDRMRNGPFDVLWNQDEWIEPNRPMAPGDEWPRRKLIQRVLRFKRWHGAARLAPPPDADLEQWGVAIAIKLGIPWDGPPQEGDKAIWLPMTIWARTAPQAIASAGRGIRRLDGFKLGAAAIRVWRDGCGDPDCGEPCEAQP